MSEYRAREQRRKAEEWAERDRRSDDADDREPTYRDGSLKTECWNSEDK